MSAIVKHITADDLWQMPNDGFRYELVDGELKRMPPAGQEHGEQAMTFGVALGSFILMHKLGKVYAAETGYRIDEHNVRAPDFSFISNERLQRIGTSPKFVRGAPDLAVEVVSPSDKKSDVREKVGWWLKVGTRLVFVVESKTKTVTAYYEDGRVVVFGENDDVHGFDVVPGFRHPVREIFG